MLGLAELKERILVTDTTVECPVKGCPERVARQRGFFRRKEGFKCPVHNIYISPSTFGYQDELDNILWKEEADRDLLEQVKTVKRESRIAHDNSEDAVTWNVFRFLERENLVSGLLSTYTESPANNPQVIYWSYSKPQKGPWSHLVKARETFETRPRAGSEPDVIVKTDDHLFLIESKLTDDNNKVLQSKDPSVRKKFESGGDGWYGQVFESDFKTVAISEKKYELMRFWLIGSWIAKRLDLDFYLVNLVLSKQERDIERIFKKHIRESQSRTFLRATWEDIYSHILRSEVSGGGVDAILQYFRNKTLGYRGGKLRRAFSVNE